MRIAVDARWIFPEITGIGAYTRELLRQLGRLGGRHEYVALFGNAETMRRTIGDAELTTASNVRCELLPYGVFSLRSQAFLPAQLRKLGIRVFHSPNYLIPLAAFPRRGGRIRCVTTIHDVIPLIFPHHAPRSRKSRLYPIYRWLMRDIGRRSDLIITDSHASASDVIRHLGIPERDAGRVRTVPCGVAERFRPAPPRPAGAASGTKILLYVGRADPYKNVVTLVRMVAQLRSTHALDVTLTMAGPYDRRYPEALHVARTLGVEKAIRWTGYLSDASLVALYQEAAVLVHASRYEGFGLQVAEAMACGVPVVCSNAGALPEVAGHAAILLDPDDVPGFAEAVRRVLASPEVAASMVARGLEQARQFTWERTARETVALYEELGA